MKAKSISAVVLILLFLSLICSCKKRDTVSPKDMYYDLERIKIDMSVSSSMKELYDPEPWEQLQSDVMEGKADRNECVRRMKKILASYGITHLRLTDLAAYDNLKRAPFWLYCYGNEYHILATTKKYEKYLGWKVIAVGGFSIEEVNNKARELTAYETPSGLKYALESIVAYKDYEELGLAEKGKIQFTFESPEGVVETVKVQAVLREKEEWVLNTVENGTPFQSNHNTSINYFLRPVAENKTLYIPFNTVQSREDYPVTALFQDILKELNTKAYDTIVFDLRFNPGGYRWLMDQELYNNKDVLGKHNIAVVITGRTYSAATDFVDTILKFYPHAKLFGEETGEAVFNYTSVQENYVLKKLNIQFCWPGVVDEVPQLYERAKDIHRGTFPDVEIGETYEGYVKGEDSIYKAIYEYYN